MEDLPELQLDLDISHEIDVWKSGKYPLKDQPFYGVADSFYGLLAGSSGRLDTAELQQEFLRIGNDALKNGIGKTALMQLFNLAEIRRRSEAENQHSN